MFKRIPTKVPCRGKKDKPPKVENMKSLSDDEACSSADRVADVDRGWAWVVCFGGFCVLLVTLGQHNCAGIIYSGLLDEFKRGRGETAWIISLASGTKHAFGPFAAFLTERFGCRVVTILGGMTCAVGLLLSSLCTSPYLLYVTYGVIWGMGTCLSYCSSLVIVSRYFRKRLSLANGIITLGSAIGGLVLSVIIQKLLENMGMKGTFLVLSGVQVIVVLSGFVYRPKSCRLDSVNTEEPAKSRALYDWSVFKNKSYVTWVLSLVVFMPAYLAPLSHIVRFAEDSGQSKLDAASLIIFMAAGTIVGRLFFGGISDSSIINRQHVMPIGQLGTAVTVTLLPALGSYPSLASFAFLLGFFEGCFITLLPVLTSDIVGRAKFSCAIGSMFFILSFPEALSTPIAGWMFDLWSSYVVAFMFCGGLTVVSICIMLLVPLFASSECQRTEAKDVTKKCSSLLGNESYTGRMTSGCNDSKAVVRETVL